MKSELRKNFHSEIQKPKIIIIKRLELSRSKIYNTLCNILEIHI
jgi:hypothetical protein